MTELQEKILSGISDKEGLLSSSTQFEICDVKYVVRTLKLRGSTLIFIGVAGRELLNEIALAMPIPGSDKVVGTTVLGYSDSSDSQNLAEKLSKRFNRQFYISFNVETDRISGPMLERHLGDFNSYVREPVFLHTPPYCYDYYHAAPQGKPPPYDESKFHYIRFPTPPSTPPEERRTQKTSIRTQSVIMKVGQGSHHVADALPLRYQEFGCESSSSYSSGFVCSWIDCGMYFKALEMLAAHVTQVHAIASSDDGLYYCKWKGCTRSMRGFNARYKMLVHVRTHTKEKPHQCHLCEKCFSRAENLKIHIRSHSGEKPYICTYQGCHKAYSNSSDRFKHTRTHSMEKPYMCKVPGCQKRYTDPSSLRKHVKTFKHAEQMLSQDCASTKQQPHKATISIDDNSEKLIHMRISEAEVQSFHNQKLSSSFVDNHFYVDKTPAGSCHMNESMNLRFKNYYTAAIPSCTGYWISRDDRDHYHKSFLLRQEEDMISVDLPLDLRTNRI